MSPVISLNIRDFRQKGMKHQYGMKPGTVGHPIPAVSLKIVDRETGKVLPSGEEGILMVKGPNLMLGYLNNPKATAACIQDGWYNTGDIAFVDHHGFIHITDRMSRFSKIAGEMVPHLRVEDAVQSLLDGENRAVVTSVPDEQKGEALVVLYTQKDKAPEALWKALGQTELPKLWIPKRENFISVEEIPMLGSGKIDLARVKKIALEKTGAVSGKG